MTIFLLPLLVVVVQSCELLRSGPQTIVDRDGVLGPVELVEKYYGGWVFMEPSKWVWIKDALIEGIFTFYDKFIVPQWVMDSGAKIVLYVAVDDFQEGKINGHVYAPLWSNSYGYITRYDITKYVNASSTVLGLNENELVFKIDNINTYGGLLFSVEVEY